MARDLISLSDLFSERLFRIPDYQRGYAWLTEQLDDFWEDLVNLRPNCSHYTGLLSIKSLEDTEIESRRREYCWLVKEQHYKPYHIVDGQQRITTMVILLNEIVCFVRNLSEASLGGVKLNAIVSKYICKERTPGMEATYLFGYEDDNPSAKYMKYRIFEEPCSDTVMETYYTNKLKDAKKFFADKIEKLYEESGEDKDGLNAVNTLYEKLTNRLVFNLLEIDNDYNVFVVFETMNNRGKKLTNLELLKNRLIYLTTLYDDKKCDEGRKSFLRDEINKAWKEVYHQLGRNENNSLSDDDFLRAHWIIYFRYSRNRGNDYIKFLLDMFSSKRIFERTPARVETSVESVISDEVTDTEDTEAVETEEVETPDATVLQPKEILDYVRSLKDMAKYWYDTYFPTGSPKLTVDEQKRIDRLNRIGIGYFRPLVTAIISRRDITPDSRIKILKAIERFIFVIFRLGNYNASYCRSDYYRAARQIYKEKWDVDKLCNEINNRTNKEIEYAKKNFVTRIEKYFSDGNGYYDWSSLKYFFYEYEANLAEKYKIDRPFLTWSMFTKFEKDMVTIEHILPQTPTKFYWQNMFRQFDDVEIRKLTGALGNLLPLSQRVNSGLQNDGFKDKKRSKDKGRRGYNNGSHSEIEVATDREDWTARDIYERTKKLLSFMQERWDFKFNDEQLEKLVGISFVNDGREIPKELIEAAPETKDVAEGSGKDQWLQFWTAFVKYAKEHGRTKDIAKQKPLNLRWYDVHIGANGYHIFFSIPYGSRIKMGIFTYNVETFNRLKKLKNQVDAEFGESLNWGYSRPTAEKGAIFIEKKADDFNPVEQPKIFEWIIDHFDRLTRALSLAGECLDLSAEQE